MKSAKVPEGHRVVGFQGKPSEPPSTMKEFLLRCGTTELAYHCRLLLRLADGHLLDVLNPRARVDFGDWLDREDLVNGKAFRLAFNLADGETRNAALHVLACLDFSGEEPLFKVARTTPGVSDRFPSEMNGADTLKSFSFFLCDLSTT